MKTSYSLILNVDLVCAKMSKVEFEHGFTEVKFSFHTCIKAITINFIGKFLTIFLNESFTQ